LELLGLNIWHDKEWHHNEGLNALYKAKQAQDTSDMEPPLVFLSNQSVKDPDYAKSLLHPKKATVTLITWTKLERFRERSKTTQGRSISCHLGYRRANVKGFELPGTEYSSISKNLHHSDVSFIVKTSPPGRVKNRRLRLQTKGYDTTIYVHTIMKCMQA
jgi:hypothetical protein